MSAELLPAVDVSRGRAVRLLRGAAGTERDFGDPLTAALAWQQGGASWVHLVDIDAAFGRGGNRDLLARVITGLDIPVQLSGGLRDEAAVAAALATGAARVVVGTAAVTDPDWLRRVVDRCGAAVAVALDVRGDRLVARGWTGDGGPLWPAVDRLTAAGAARYVVTDVDRDGALAGPNLPLLRAVGRRTGRPVVASGGVRDTADLRALAALPEVEGVVVGTALYTGALSIADALAAVGEPS